MDDIDRRQFLQRAGAAGGVGVAGLAGVAGALDVIPTVGGSHDDPEGNPLAGFGGTQCDVPRTSDTYLPFETEMVNGKRYGGWGGHEYHDTGRGFPGGENPVVFVHGNTHDACDFSDHATRFLDRGYGGDQLWSITFREATSTHAEMARQLEHFVGNILATTGANTVDVVSHSLGVTGVRMWMADVRQYLEDGGWPSVDLSIDEPAARARFDRVDTFVGCAGANHGTYTCGPCEKGLGSAEPCNVISPLCADEPGEPLFDLNHYGVDCTGVDPADCEENETPRDATVDYYTIRGQLDYFYLQDPESPKLEGATNVFLPAAAHNATRASDVSIELIYQWVTEGSRTDRTTRETVASASGSRSDAADVYTAGQTARVELTVEADRPVILRDRIPYTWDVVHTDADSDADADADADSDADVDADADSDDVTAVAPRPHRGVKEVYFDCKRPKQAHSVEYFVEAPDESGSYDFGPAEVRTPDATEWADVPDTRDRNVVVGVSS